MEKLLNDSSCSPLRIVVGCIPYVYRLDTSMNADELSCSAARCIPSVVGQLHKRQYLFNCVDVITASDDSF